MKAAQKEAAQYLLEQWWDHAWSSYGESYGSEAVRLSTNLPLQAKVFVEVLGLRPTKEMKRAIKKGSL